MLERMRFAYLLRPTGFCLALIWTVGLAVGPMRGNASGESRFEVQPIASTSVVYDDNIFLEPADKESDLITSVSPGIRLQAREDKDSLEAEYSPTFVWYRDHSDNNTIRHDARLDLAKYLSRHLKFELKEAYLKTEEPLERLVPDLEILNIRRSRRTYWRNTAGADLAYQFGPWSNLTGGYDYEILENSDPLVDDARKYGPSASISYGFDIRNLLTISLAQSRYEFEKEIGPTTINDFDGLEGTARYTYRFNPHTSVYFDYNLSYRDFQNLSPDYTVHTGKFGWNHAVSRHTTLNLETGYFIQNQTGLENTDGFVYTAGWNKQIERGSIQMNVQSGWNETFLVAEPRGFSRYRSVGGRFDYRLQENLNSYAAASYWENETPEGLTDDILDGSLGLRRDFLRWYVAALEYSHRIRTSDIPTDEYTDNRITLTFSFQKPFGTMY